MAGRTFAAITFLASAALAWQALAPHPARAQTAGPSFAIEPDHVAFSVPNLDQSIAWYGHMLGFKLVRRVTPKGKPAMQIALLQHGDFYIELFQVKGARPMPAYRRDPTADLSVHGMKHFGFRVKDARAAAAALKAKGAHIALGPVENARSIFVFVSDNAGNTFELIQRKK